jgi:hypothetical protein
LRLEIRETRNLLCRGLAGVVLSVRLRVVRLLVHNRLVLPLGLVWVAPIDARRVGATSSLDIKP